MGRNPQVPLAHHGEDGRLHDRIWVKIMQLYLIVVDESPHESLGRYPEPPV
jgi:hypothetical protein